MRSERVVLHLMGSNGLQASRFLKEAETALRHDVADRVALVCLNRGGLPETEVTDTGVEIRRVAIRSRALPANKVLALVKIAEAYLRQSTAGRRYAPAVVHCHSISPLAASARVKHLTGARLLYDAHELETERNGLNGVRQAFDRRLERRLIGTCDAVLVVSDSIADWYVERYGIARPTVVRNVPDVRTQRSFAGSRLLREKLNVPDDAILFLYLGGLSRGRRVEQLLRVFARADQSRHVVFLGYGELEPMVRDGAAGHRNIHFLPAVPPHEVLRYTASADVGVVGVENVCLSYYYSLPNKLFEYILAGIPVLAGHWPEIARVVEGYDCGWTHHEEDEALLATVEGITRSGIEARRPGIARAQQVFSWEHEEQALLEVYRMLGAPPRVANPMPLGPGPRVG